MRISPRTTLALYLSAGVVAAGVAYATLQGAAAAAPAASAPPTASQCQPLPVASTPTPTPSATASDTASATTAASTQVPVDLCVSVSASADSFAAGQAATWNVGVWTQNGPVTGVTVTLTGTISGQAATFTSKCPGGNGGSSCLVGDMATSVTASSDTMQAQITIPSGTAAGTSVILTAAANATPPLPTEAAADTAVSVTAAASPTSSPTATSTATSAAAAATSAGATLAPGLGIVPGVVSNPQSGVSAITNPGSITSLLPAITPGASPTAPTAGLVTSPAADNPASPGATAAPTTASNFVLIVPAATAEKIALVVLLLLVAYALRMRSKDRVVISRAAPSREPRGVHRERVAGRRFGPFVITRRQSGDAPGKTLDDAPGKTPDDAPGKTPDHQDVLT